METIVQKESLHRRLLKGLLLPLMFALILPPICSWILGYEWSGQQVNHVPTAIVDHDNSSMSRELVSYIKSNQAFDVKLYTESDNDVKKWMDESKIAVGVIIPEDFMSDIMSGKESKIMMIYDGSQMSMVGAVKTRINEIMATIRTGYLMQVMEGKLGMTPTEAENYLQPVAYTTRMLGNPAKSSANFTLQGLILNICQVSIYCLGVEVGDAIRKRRNRFSDYISGALVCGLVGTITAINAILVQVGIFKSPFNGPPSAALVLTVLNMVLVGSLGILVVTMTKKKIGALSASTIVLATVLLSGYSYPVVAMPKIFQKLSQHIHYSHYAIPLRDITLMGVGFEQVMPHIYWLARFILIEWLLILLISKVGVLREGIRSMASGHRKTGGIDQNA